MSMQKLEPLILLAAVAFLAIALSYHQAWSNPPADKPPRTHDDKVEAARTKLTGIERAISDLNTKRPCDADTQCEIVEGGARNCGGPSKFFVVSTSNPKTYAQLKTKIIEYTKAEETLNNLEYALGCTDVPAAADAICGKSGQCELKKR